MAYTQTCNSSGSNPPLLSLDHVTKSYGRGRVLDVAKLDLAAGDCLGIIGTNASGKSTLLRILAGVSRETSGSIHRSPKMRNLRIGFVPQNGGVNPELSVTENLSGIARLYDWPLAPPADNWPYVTKFGLERLLDQPVRNLSGGYQKLVSLVAVLSVEPEALFLDEPFSGLDQHHVDLVNSVIGTITKDCELLVVTGHGRKDIVHCTRSIVLVDGSPT